MLNPASDRQDGRCRGLYSVGSVWTDLGECRLLVLVLAGQQGSYAHASPKGVCQSKLVGNPDVRLTELSGDRFPRLSLGNVGFRAW